MNNIQKLFSHVMDEVLDNGKSIGTVDIQTRFMDVYKYLVNENILDVESWAYKLLGYQTLGGDCPVCGKTWKKKECNPMFTNGDKAGTKIASYHYFIPACSCIPICPGCGNIMLVEYYEERTKCTVCETRFRCLGWIDKQIGKKKIRTRCEGYYRPARGRFVCDECGHEKYIYGGIRL